MLHPEVIEDRFADNLGATMLAATLAKGNTADPYPEDADLSDLTGLHMLAATLGKTTPAKKKHAVALGHQNDPFPMVDTQALPDGAHHAIRRVIGNELLLYTEREDLDAVVAEMFRTIPTPSLLPTFKRLLEVLDPNNPQRILAVVTGPGTGKTSMFREVSNLTSSMPGESQAYYLYDCTGAEVAEAFFKPIKDASSVGIDFEYGPIIKGMLEGLPVILDEFTRGNKPDILLNVTDFLGNVNGKPDDVLEIPNMLGENFRIKRKDIKPGFGLLLTGNYLHDVDGGTLIPEALKSRLQIEEPGKYTVDDWSARICHLLTGMHVSTLHALAPDAWNKNSKAFADYLVKRRTAHAGSKVPEHQIKLLQNWEATLHFAEKMGEYLCAVEDLVRTDPAALRGRDVDLRKELQGMQSLETVDPRKIGTVLSRAINGKEVAESDKKVSIKTTPAARTPVAPATIKPNTYENLGTKIVAGVDQIQIKIAGKGTTPNLYSEWNAIKESLGLNPHGNNSTIAMLDEALGGSTPAPSVPTKKAAPKAAPDVSQLPSTTEPPAAPAAKTPAARPSSAPKPRRNMPLTLQNVMQMVSDAMNGMAPSATAVGLMMLPEAEAENNKSAANMLKRVKGSRSVFAVDQSKYDNVTFKEAEVRDYLRDEHTYGNTSVVDLLVTLAMPLVSKTQLDNLMKFNLTADNCRNNDFLKSRPQARAVASGQHNKVSATVCTLSGPDDERLGRHRALVMLRRGDETIVASHTDLTTMLGGQSSLTLEGLLKGQKITHYNLDDMDQRSQFASAAATMTQDLTSKEKMAVNAALAARIELYEVMNVGKYVSGSTVEISQDKTAPVGKLSIHDDDMLRRLLERPIIVQPSYRATRGLSVK